MLVLIGTKTYPLAKAILHYNEVIISPWSGEVWARIDRGRSEWFPTRRPKEGEPYWPIPEHIPGSIYCPYQEWKEQVIDELSIPLLDREFRLLAGFTSATLRDNIDPTLRNTDHQMTTNTLLDKIAEIRLKAANGTATAAELREALRVMRAERISATARSTASKARKAEVTPEDALKAFLG